MNPVIAAVLCVAVIAVAAWAFVAIVVAHKLVARAAPESLLYELVADNIIQLHATPQTTAPGEYGFFYEDKHGHAHIGPVVGLDDAKRLVRRTVLSASGVPLPSRGVGHWARDVYPTPAALGLAFENVEIATAVGPAPAWVVVPGEDPATTVWAIHLHGIRTTRSVVLPSVAALSGLGIASLIPSWRHDGEGPDTSAGRSSLGQEEWKDADEALAFAVSRGAESVILVGWSMGGLIATLLQHKSRFATYVVGAILIAPVTSWRSVLEHAVRVAHLPPFIAGTVERMLGTRVLCALAGLTSPVKLSALDMDAFADEQDIPTLIIHNPADNVVPHSLVLTYANRRPDTTTLVVFDDTAHATEWNREPKRFEKTIQEWTAALISARHRRRPDLS